MLMLTERKFALLSLGTPATAAVERVGPVKTKAGRAPSQNLRALPWTRLPQMSEARALNLDILFR